MVRMQILKARGESRDRLLERGNTRISENKLTFNITYYLAFQNVRSILEEIQLLLAPDKEHKKVFPEVLILRFRNDKSLKDYLVRAALPMMGNAGGSEPCGKGTCQVCDHIITTNTFTTKSCGEVFKFQSGPLTITQKRFFTFWDAKFMTILPMLEKLKQSFVFGLIIITVNTYLIVKEKRMYRRSVFIHTMFKIATEVLMIGKQLYLRSVKCTNNLKKGRRFGNTNYKHFSHLA